MLVEGNELHRTRLALRDVGCLLHKVEGGGGEGQRGRRVKWKEGGDWCDEEREREG